MTFKQNRKNYIKKCNILSDYYLEMALNFKELSKAIEEQGIEEDIRVMIDKRLQQWGLK